VAPTLPAGPQVHEKVELLQSTLISVWGMDVSRGASQA
jgi:hypothetical protein